MDAHTVINHGQILMLLKLPKFMIVKEITMASLAQILKIPILFLIPTVVMEVLILRTV
jgi:hypothetical protein